MLYTGPIEWVEEAKEEPSEEHTIEFVGVTNGDGTKTKVKKEVKKEKEEEEQEEEQEEQGDTDEAELETPRQSDGNGGNGGNGSNGGNGGNAKGFSTPKEYVADPIVVGILKDIRVYMETLLQPLYDFMGSVEAELGGTSTGYHFKFRSGVHSANVVKTLDQIESMHQHIPRILLAHLRVQYDPNIEEGTKQTQMQQQFPFAFSTTTVNARININQEDGWSPIGNNDGDGDNNDDDDVWEQVYANLPLIYSTVLSFASHGALVLVAEEINEATGKEFTVPQLVMSKSVRFMFARLVGKKLSVARSQSQAHRVSTQQANRVSYFISPSYRQLSAQSKWVLGAKLWFEHAYVKVKAPGQDVDTIRALIENVFTDRPNRAQALQNLAQHDFSRYDVIMRIKPARRKRRHGQFLI